MDFNRIKEMGLEYAEKGKNAALDLAEKGKTQALIVNEQGKLLKAQRQLGALGDKQIDRNTEEDKEQDNDQEPVLFVINRTFINIRNSRPSTFHLIIYISQLSFGLQ